MAFFDFGIDAICTSKENRIVHMALSLLSYLGKKIVIMRFTLLILALLASFTISNYLDEHVYMSKMILPHTHAKVDQNDSSPLVGMNMCGRV